MALQRGRGVDLNAWPLVAPRHLRLDFRGLPAVGLAVVRVAPLLAQGLRLGRAPLALHREHAQRAPRLLFLQAALRVALLRRTLDAISQRALVPRRARPQGGWPLRRRLVGVRAYVPPHPRARIRHRHRAPVDAARVVAARVAQPGPPHRWRARRLRPQPILVDRGREKSHQGDSPSVEVRAVGQAACRLVARGPPMGAKTLKITETMSGVDGLCCVCGYTAWIVCAFERFVLWGDHTDLRWVHDFMCNARSSLSR
eukprot:scaffold58331_cov64-Phaeocystis_antarctica.AAC.1